MISRFFLRWAFLTLSVLGGLLGSAESASGQSRASWANINLVAPQTYWITGQENVYVYFHVRAGTGWMPGAYSPWVHTKVDEYADGVYLRTIEVRCMVGDGKVTHSSTTFSNAWTYTTFDMAMNSRNLVGDGILYEGNTRIGTATPIKVNATWVKPKPAGVTASTVNYSLEVDVVVNLDDPCDACSTCAGGENVDVGSVDFSFDLGRDAKGKSGALSCKSEIASPSLATTGSLQATLPASFEVIRSINGTSSSTTGNLRQIRSATELTDLVTISATQYEIRHYDNAAVGAKVNGLYTINSGYSPIRKYLVENPGAAGTFHRLKISKFTSGTSADYFYEYEYTSATDSWKLTKPDGTSESIATTYNAGKTQKTEIRTFKSSTGTDIKIEKEVYDKDAKGIWRKTQHVLDPAVGGANLTTTYEYWNSTSAAGSFGKLKRMQSHDGAWEYLEYGTNGYVSKHVRPFGSTLPTDPDNVQDVTTSTFAAIAGGWNRETKIRTVAGNEVERTYIDRLCASVGIPYLSKEKEIRAISPGAAATNAANLITERAYFTSGDFRGKMNWELRPDGTGTLVTYTTLLDGSTEVKTRVGQLNSTTAPTALVNGTETVEVFNVAYQLASKTVKEWSGGAAGLTLESSAGSNPDSFGRYQTMTYADGTSALFQYGCCGLEAQTDRFGLETTYQRDFRRRPTVETRQGVQTALTYDAAGNLKTISRGPVGGSLSTIETNEYNLAGQKIWTKDALNHQTGFAESFNGTTGIFTRTTTYPDTLTTGDTTRVENYARDGQMVELTGTAVRPMKHQCGVEQEGGIYRLFCKDIQIGEAGAETEWTKTYKDALGRDYKILFAGTGSPSITRTYDAQGRLNKQVDPDGVTTLFGYNNLGEQETTAIEASGGNSTIDLSGNDRIRKSVVSYGNVTFDGASHPARITTVSEWTTNGANTSVEVQKSEQSLNSLHQKQTTYGLVTEFKYNALPSSGAWSTTTKSPDGSTVTETYANGRLTTREQKDSNGARLGKTTHSYDTLGRLSSAEDVRNGATTYTYTALDQVQTVTTPVPGPGQSAQVTSYEYTPRGKLKKEILPDLSETLHEYHPTDDLKRSYGSQTYDVSYSYTPQGRMKTMATSSGTTTWHYDSARGFLSSKEDAASKAVSYTYKPSGRLWTRTWARGVITTYSYNSYGDLSGIDYSDSTPDVTYSVYDRRGRNTEVSDAAGTWTLAYNAAGDLASESVAGGILNGASILRGYDSLLRRNSLTTSMNSTTLQTVGYVYDPYVSRLKEVNDGSVNKSRYTYVADSNLVDTLTHTHNSTDVMFTKKEYDYLDRLTSITSRKASDNSILTRYAYQYNNLNQRTRATTTDDSFWSYNYDSLGQVTKGKRYCSNNTAVPGQDYAYAFDGIGNRTTTQTNGRTSTYTTNNVNEITERTVPGALDIIGQANPDATVTVDNLQAVRGENGYFYKALPADNSSGPVWQSVTSRAVLGGTPPSGDDTMTEQTGSLYLSGTPEAFSYDDDGNMTSDGRWSVLWDGENRAVSFEAISSVPAAAKKKVECKYDGRGRRIEKKSYTWNAATSSYDLAATIRFVYDGWNLIAELNGGGNLIRSYRWGSDLSGSIRGAGGVGGLLSITVAGSSKTYLPCYDGNGNILAYIDAADRSIAASFEFGAFGELLKAPGLAVTDCLFRFSTKYSDAETGLHYYGFRYYNPSKGGWINRDPIGERGGQNLYAFIDNSTTSGWDMLGLDGSMIMPGWFGDRGLSDLEKAFPRGPRATDHLGENEFPPHVNTDWFNIHYPGLIEEVKKDFSERINQFIARNCGLSPYNIATNLPVEPVMILNNPHGDIFRPRLPDWSRNEDDFGDRPQSGFSAAYLLGKFNLVLRTPVHIRYVTLNENKKVYAWAAEIVLEDTLGLQKHDNMGINWMEAFPERVVERAKWTIVGTGCCTTKSEAK